MIRAGIFTAILFCTTVIMNAQSDRGVLWSSSGGYNNTNRQWALDHSYKLSLDKKYLACKNAGYYVQINDVANAKMIGVARVPDMDKIDDSTFSGVEVPNSMEWNQDNELFTLSYADRGTAVYVWDIQGNLLRTLWGSFASLSNRIQDIAFYDSLLYTLHWRPTGNTIGIWNRKTLSLIDTLFIPILVDGNTKLPVLRITVFDGNTMALYRQIGAVEIWSIKEKRKSQYYPSNSVPSLKSDDVSIEFSPNGRFLRGIGYSFLHGLGCWSIDLTNNKSMGGLGYMYAFADNNEWYCEVSPGNGCRIKNLTNDMVMQTITTQSLSITRVDFMDNDKKLLLVYFDGTSDVIDISSDKIVATPRGITDVPVDIQYSPNDKYLAITEYSGEDIKSPPNEHESSVTILDANTGKRITRYTVSDITSVTFADDDNVFITSRNTLLHKYSIYNQRFADSIMLENGTARILGIALNSTETVIAVWYADSSLSLINTATKTLLHKKKLNNSIVKLWFYGAESLYAVIVKDFMSAPDDRSVGQVVSVDWKNSSIKEIEDATPTLFQLREQFAGSQTDRTYPLISSVRNNSDSIYWLAQSNIEILNMKTNELSTLPFDNNIPFRFWDVTGIDVSPKDGSVFLALDSNRILQTTLHDKKTLTFRSIVNDYIYKKDVIYKYNNSFVQTQILRVSNNGSSMIFSNNNCMLATFNIADVTSSVQEYSNCGEQLGELALTSRGNTIYLSSDKEEYPIAIELYTTMGQLTEKIELTPHQISFHLPNMLARQVLLYKAYRNNKQIASGVLFFGD